MNGLNINVSEDDFKAKPTAEQSWMIYKAIEAIDNNGCKFSRLRHESDKKTNWKAAVIVGAGSFGGLAGSLFAFWKYVLCR
jgi:hypothetical protein